jgi:DNA-binding transcriptional ArsR family regulator
MNHDQREALAVAHLDPVAPVLARVNGTARPLPLDPEDEAPLPPLRAYDVHELAGMTFKPRDPLLGPWLHTQDLCMLFAGRGIGKTHFALSVAYAVAGGGRFIRWQAPAARKVLYLDGELPGAVMQKRLLMHCPAVAEPAPGFFRVFTPDLVPDGRTLPDLSTRDGQDLIDQMIEPDTALVVVDNLSAWARSGRENEAESWHPIAEWILALRRRGIAVLLVHHAGKGGQQRGTSKREDLLDVVIGLSRPRDYDPQKGAVFVVDFTKARNLMGEDAESLELELAGDEDRAEWRWRTVESSTFDRVVDLANEGLRPNEIAVELEVNKSTVSRHLRKARADGLITADAGKDESKGGR